MINPAQSLAFSIQSSPGGYALLLGSGLSTSAGIPTGWEIMLDLISKLATVQGETCETEKEEIWYQDKFGAEVNYSDLIHGLSKKQAERQQLLRPYFEPNEEERERGEKQPTVAHQAIAALAARGFIRVIITTNFDRLLESALKEKGVEPTVLSTADQMTGALPLHQIPCCLIKVHGDYLDPSHIRNTTTELTEYSDEINRLLERIFDEYGLVVCGWSAEWDGALRDAMSRNKSRRYTTYWTVHGEKGNYAQQLINHIKAEEIHIKDADSFFQELQDQVEAIEDFAKPHPLSAKIAVASLKRYMSSAQHLVQFSDLIDKEVTHINEITSGDDFHITIRINDREALNTLVRRYEEACTTLLMMAAVGGFWAEESHYPVWERALRRLALIKSENVKNFILRDLQKYPAMLLLYTLGIGALEANRLPFLGHLFAVKILNDNYRSHEGDEREVSTIQGLNPTNFFSYTDTNLIITMLDGTENSNMPLHDWLHNTIWSYTKDILLEKDRYSFIFDKLELLVSLGVSHQSGGVSRSVNPLIGTFLNRPENYQRIHSEIHDSLFKHINKSPYVTCGIFGDTEEVCTNLLYKLKNWYSPENSRGIGWR